MYKDEIFFHRTVQWIVDQEWPLMTVTAQFKQTGPLSCINVGFFPDRVMVGVRIGHFQVISTGDWQTGPNPRHG